MMRRDRSGWVCREHGRVCLNLSTERCALNAAERQAIQHLRDAHPELLVLLAGVTITRVAPEGGDRLG